MPIIAVLRLIRLYAFELVETILFLWLLYQLLFRGLKG